MNLLEPWVLLRLVAGLTATLLFARAAQTSARVLRHWDVASATEGQLALEKQLDLSRTYVRVAAVAQIGALVLLVLAADRLSRGVRGAMCGWGVLAANPWGFRAVASSALVALLVGVVAQMFAFDAKNRNLALARPLAWATLIAAPLSAFDLALNAQFLLDLDLTVVSSCCSVQVDALGAADDGFASGPRVLVAWGAALSVLVTLALALWARRSPTRVRTTLAGAASLLALPLAVGAAMLEVAPHAFETPHHACPFCLFKPEVFALGYPLFGAMLLATIRLVGVGVCVLLTRGDDGGLAALRAFTRRALSVGVASWAVAAVAAVAPVVRYFVVSNGAPLFP